MFTQKAQFPTMCTAEHLVEFRNCHGGHHSWSPVNIPYPTSVGGSWPHWGLSPSSIWLFPLPWLTFPELYSASWQHFLSKLLVLKIFPPTFLWRELKLRYMQNRCLIENNWEHFCLKKKIMFDLHSEEQSLLELWAFWWMVVKSQREVFKGNSKIYFQSGHDVTD